MNKIFKVLMKHGQAVVTSEFGTVRGTLKALVMTYSALCVGSALAMSSTISTVGQGNIVTGDKGVSDGYQNIVTAVQGTAQGVEAIATGNNLSKEDFFLKLNEYQGLIESKTRQENELETIKTNIDLNQHQQENLNKQIEVLNQHIDTVEQKSQHLTELAAQEADKHNELTQLQEALNLAKKQTETVSQHGGDKTIWTDFTSQLGRLSWQKLSDNSHGTSGSHKLALDLKHMVEIDYPDFTDQWSLSSYEDVIAGYINRQGLFDSNQDTLGRSYHENTNYVGFAYDYIGGTPLLGNVMSYEQGNNRYNVSGGNSLANHLEKISEVKSTDINIAPLFTMSPKQYENMVMKDDVQSMYAFYNLKQLINSPDENPIKHIAKNYSPIIYRYTDFYGKANSTNKDFYSKTVLELPPVSDVASIEFIAQKDLHYFLENTFKNELGSVNNGIFSDKNAKAFISNTDIQYLRDWLTSFYSNFYQKIDVNAKDSAWLFDKENYLLQLTKVEQFSAKLQDYVAAYDSAVANPEDTEAQVRLVTLYNQIRTEKNDLTNYYEHIQVNLKPSTLDLFKQQAVKSAQELTRDAKKLKLYDVHNEVIKGVIEAAQHLKMDVDNAQRSVDEKQVEIDEIQRQINELALTDDEKNAADLKQRKMQELANKQADKIRLEEEQLTKQTELENILNQLRNTGLANLGHNSIAHGVQAFSSGEDAIAIGSNAIAQHSQTIAIGKDNLVTQQASIAMGSQNHVMGTHSIAIGSNNHINAENTVVLGHNIHTAVENSVGLGANTTLEQAIATSGTVMGGQTYTYAGSSPIGTVSIGTKNAERTLTNVAAGRVSKTSTDAINGSQLYALQDYISQMQSPNTTISVSNVDVVAGRHIESVEKTTDENGKITYTVNAIGYVAGEGVQISEPQHGNRTIRVNGVKTKTDDGRTYQRGDLNQSLEIKGDSKNISTQTNDSGAVHIRLADDLHINSLAINNGPSLSKQGINANNTVIQHVADGVKPTDAVNIRQLQQQGNTLHQRINHMEKQIHKNQKRVNAGIASVAAMSNIPQVMLAGKSGLGVGIGHRSQQTAIAVGYSRASDNAKHIVKLSAGIDTQHKTTLGAGYMYQW